MIAMLRGLQWQRGHSMSEYHRERVPMISTGHKALFAEGKQQGRKLDTG